MWVPNLYSLRWSRNRAIFWSMLGVRHDASAGYEPYVPVRGRVPARCDYERHGPRDACPTHVRAKWATCRWRILGTSCCYSEFGGNIVCMLSSVIHHLLLRKIHMHDIMIVSSARTPCKTAGTHALTRLESRCDVDIHISMLSSCCELNVKGVACLLGLP